MSERASLNAFVPFSERHHGPAGPATFHEGVWTRFCLCGEAYESREGWRHVPALFDHIVTQWYGVFTHKKGSFMCEAHRRWVKTDGPNGPVLRRCPECSERSKVVEIQRPVTGLTA